MTVLEQEYMRRMPNEIRELRKSIDNLAEILKPIAEKCKTEIGIDPERIVENIKALTGKMETIDKG